MVEVVKSDIYVLKVELTLSADSLDVGCERKELKKRKRKKQELNIEYPERSDCCQTWIMEMNRL